MKNIDNLNQLKLLKSTTINKIVLNFSSEEKFFLLLLLLLYKKKKKTAGKLFFFFLLLLLGLNPLSRLRCCLI